MSDDVPGPIFDCAHFHFRSTVDILQVAKSDFWRGSPQKQLQSTVQ